MSPRALFALALVGFVISLSVSVASRGEPAPARPAAPAFASGPALQPPEELRNIGAPAPAREKADAPEPAPPPEPPPVAPAAAAREGVDAYRGTGAWVDQYDSSVLDNPYPALAEMKRRGVRTVYWETGSWRLPRSENFRDRVATELAIDQSHKLGMKIVAWYLPGLDTVRLDMRRTRAAIRLRTDLGERFDGYAADIESQRITAIAARNAALMRYSRALRRYVGDDYALGAIVPDQRSSTISPGLWPGLPYAELASLYDVFLPMAYSTYRGRGSSYVYSYTRANVEYVRAATRRPVHIIGGLDPLPPAEPSAVVRGARDGGAIGASFYDFVGATPSTWRALKGAP
jgi:hypothetical protein